MKYPAIYLAVAFHALMALCFLTGPFQVPDEFAHYFRAVQLSHGEAKIVVAPDNKSAGGEIDTSAIATAALFDTLDFRSSRTLRMSSSQIKQAYNIQSTNYYSYKDFSNTVIYFPITHTVAAIGVSLGRAASLPALAWLYTGRMCNIAAALMVSALAISTFGSKGIYIFAVSLSPMTLFEEASLAADAIVIPAGLLLAAITYKLSKDEPSNSDYVLLFVALLACAVGKFAYMPLVFVPPAVALFERRVSLTVINLTILSLVVLATWFAWTRYAGQYVFNMREHLPEGTVDFYRQIRFILSHPLRFLMLLASSMANDFKMMVSMSMGKVLGWESRLIPKPLLYLAFLTVSLSVIASGGIKITWKSRALIAATLSACYTAIYVLVYLQFDPVGQPFIDGPQGRYLLPLSGFILFVIPSFRIPKLLARLRGTLLAASAVVAFSTVAFVGVTYWM